MTRTRRSFLKHSARGALLPFATAAACPWLSGEERADSAHPRAHFSIRLDKADPSRSSGTLQVPGHLAFPPIPVGYGKHGIKAAGQSFAGGWSLAGKFKINAILTRDSFAMTDELIAESGRSREWLAEHLFANMSSIDFDGDGKAGEYGAAFIGLAPKSTAPQPFHFGKYRGVFRWYSYAIHGTQDPARIGKKITGGCINVGEKDLDLLAEHLSLGDRVTVETV